MGSPGGRTRRFSCSLFSEKKKKKTHEDQNWGIPNFVWHCFLFFLNCFHGGNPSVYSSMSCLMDFFKAIGQKMSKNNFSYSHSSYCCILLHQHILFHQRFWWRWHHRLSEPLQVPAKRGAQRVATAVPCQGQKTPGVLIGKIMQKHWNNWQNMVNRKTWCTVAWTTWKITSFTVIGFFVYTWLIL